MASFGLRAVGRFKVLLPRFCLQYFLAVEWEVWPCKELFPPHERFVSEWKSRSHLWCIPWGDRLSRVFDVLASSA